MKLVVGAIGSLVSFGLALGALPGGASMTPVPLAGANVTMSAGAAPAAAPLSGRAAKAALKSARASMRGGRLVEALDRYEAVVASTSAFDEARGEALYWAGFLRVSPDPRLRDIDRARAYLGELKVFHAASGHQDEASVLLAVTEEMADASRSAALLRAEIAARSQEVETCRAEKQAVDGRLQAAIGENEMLKESDSAHRAEIQGLRDEVKRKDEALRKVKEVVVGWKAPR